MCDAEGEGGLLSVPRRVLVTGGAGFIGGHLAHRLLSLGHTVTAIDSMLPYYDVSVKRGRVVQLQKQFGDRFSFIEASAGDPQTLEHVFDLFKPHVVVHLAAQAGVRYCEEFKDEARINNIETTERLLQKALFNYDGEMLHFVSASSSSVYGCLPRPWSEHLEPAPEGVYATSKKIGEQLCRDYAARRREELKDRSPTGMACLRFFTVYGPEGRPDMAPGKFLDLIHRGLPIPIFGDGSAIRDFTFVDDIIQGIIKTIDHPRPFEIYNLGRGSSAPHSVLDLINAIETSLGKKAITNFLPPQAGDVPATQADISKARSILGYDPLFPLDEGISMTVRWYLNNITKVFAAVSLSSSSSSPSSSSSLLSLSPLPDVLLGFSSLSLSSSPDSSQRSPLLLSINGAEEGEEGQTPLISTAARFLQSQVKSGSLSAVSPGVKGDANVFVLFGQSGDKIESKDLLSQITERISNTGSEIVIWSLRRSSDSPDDISRPPQTPSLPSLSSSSSGNNEALSAFVAERPDSITTANCAIRLDVLSSILSALNLAEDLSPNVILTSIVSHALTKSQFYRISTLPDLVSSLF